MNLETARNYRFEWQGEGVAFTAADAAEAYAAALLRVM